MTTAGSQPVASLVSDAPATIEADASLYAVARAMADADVGLLIVGDGERPRGVVSERDVVRALAAARAPGSTTATDIAQSDLVWCDATATVAEVAAEMMVRYVRHVLVEEDGRLLGVVSARDLLGVYAAADLQDDP